MKKWYSILVFFLLYAGSLQGQIIFSEDFNQSNGSSITWTSDCSGSDITVTTPGLSYPGYIGSGLGNSALISSSLGQRSHSQNFSNFSSPVYVGFLVNVQAANFMISGGGCAPGTDVILAFDPNAGGSGNDHGLILQSAGGTFRFGLDSDFGNIFTGSTYNYNQTYLVVLKRTFGTISLFINPTLGSAEPASDLSHPFSNGSGNNANGLSISGRSGSDLSLDGIRMSTNWNDIVFTSPSTQASNINFPVIPNTNSIDLNWTNGNGNGRIVVAKAGGAVTGFPVDGTNYFGNSSFGSGSEIGAGTGNYVVSNSLCCGTSVSVTNLNPATTYSFWVFEYNQSGGSILYNLLGATANPASATTLASEPGTQASNINFTSVNIASMRVNWANGGGTERLVVASNTGSIFNFPVDGTAYTGNSNYLSAPDLGSENRVVYRGNGTFVDVIGLTPGVQYAFRVFELNGTLTSANYNTFTNTNNPNTRFTIANPPGMQASGTPFTNVTNNSMQVNWTSGTGTQRLVIASAGVAVSQLPVSGTSYTADSFLGNGTNLGSNNYAVYQGSGNSFTVSNLNPGITYHFRIFEFNGSGESSSYFTSTASLNPQSRITLANEPSAHAVPFTATRDGVNGTGQINLVFQAASFITNAAGYIILRRQDGSNPSATGILDGAVAPGTPVAGTTVIATVVSTATTSYNDTGVVPGTQYNYALIPYGFLAADPLTYNFRTIPTIPTANATTLSLEPALHPALFTATRDGTNSTSQINLAFSFASSITNASGYIILRRQDLTNPTTTNVTDGAVVTPPGGTTLVTTISGTGINSFNDTGLSPGIQYNYAIIPYGISGSNTLTYNYLITAGFRTANATTLSLEPLTHPVSFTATTAGTNQIDLTFSAASTITNASGYIILRLQGVGPPTSAGVADATTTPPTPTGGTTLVTTITNTTFTSFSDATVSPGLQYSYAIFAYGYNGTNPLSYNYLLTAGKTSNAFTLSNEPIAHPLTFTASQTGTNQITLNFQAANLITNAAGYIILRRQDGSNPTISGITDGTVTPATPVAGTTLITTITNTATTSFLDAVSPGIQYNYAIIPYGYNGTNAQTYNYKTNATVQTANVFMLSLEPSAHATGFTATQAGTSQINLAFSPANLITNAAGYIILRRQGSDPTNAGITDGAATPTTPIAGTTLVTTITNTATIAFNDTGLSSGIQYNYAIIPYGYNGTNAQTYNYRNTAFPTTNATTVVVEPTAQPTGVNFTAINTTSYTVNFTASSGGAAGYIAFRRMGSSPTTAVPVDGTTYTVTTTLGDGYIAYIGPGTSFSESVLAVNTVYFYDIFAYNGSGVTLNYLPTSPMEGSQTTLVTGPTNQPTSIGFTNIQTTTLDASFTASAGGASGYLAIRKAGGLPTGVPVDGTTYSAGTSIGDGVVAYSGSPISFTDTGLTPGGQYFYSVFAFNGSSGAINYLSTSPLNSSSVVTKTIAPVTSAASSISDVGFTANWAAVTNASNYSLFVSTANDFSSLVAGYNPLSVSGITQAVTGLSPGTTYYYKVRSNNSVAVASADSSPITVLLVPAPPVAVQPTPQVDVTQSSFVAKWNASSGADEYYLDVTTDPTLSFPIVGFANKNISGATSASVTGLTAGATYYYQVRAKNATNTSGNSNPITQVTIPLTPTNFRSSNALSNSFVLQWNAATGASGYEIDVLDANSNFISGYNAKPVGNVVFTQVTGLSPSTLYVVAVRAVNAGGVSPSSSQEIVSTADASGAGGGTQVAPEISIVTATGTNAVKSSITTNTGFNNSITYYHRKITEAKFTKGPTVSGNSMEVQYDEGKDLDQIGMEYYFKAVDIANRVDSTNYSYVYTPIVAVAIPELKAGGTSESYQILSIPVELADKSITSVFQEVISFYGGPDKTKWRLVQYKNGKNGDFPEVLTQIEKGKGYWFNSKEQVSIKVSGTSIPASQTNDFKLSLDQGWTQIGNPFPFPISWIDVLAKNGNPSGVGKLFTYDAASVSFKESGGLKAWEGGFVKSDNSTTINIPVTVKQSASGRGSGYKEIESRDLSSDEWFLPLTLQSGKAYNEMGGIGMHPDARQSNDRYDEQSLPRFVRYLELNSYHQEHFLPRFTRDVVPSAINHNWEFTVESNFDEKEATIKWDNKSFDNNDAQLLLYDVDVNILVDMKLNSEYHFEINEKHRLKFFYSIDGKSLLPDITGIGRPYPNPSSAGITIPFVAGANSPELQIAVYDLMGKQVKLVAAGRFEPGVHEVIWDGNDAQSVRVAQGVYIYRLTSANTPAQQGRVILK